MGDAPCYDVCFFAQKKDKKGEDFFAQNEDCSWAGVSFSFFAIFDGHGGAQVGDYCKREMLNEILAAMDQLAGDSVSNGTSTALAAWCENLPRALVLAFEGVDSHCNSNIGVSGATATVAVVTGIPSDTRNAGMLITVANVGDSHAVLDMDTEVFLLSEDHRCDVNKAEQQRVRASGGSVDYHFTDADKIEVTAHALKDFYVKVDMGKASDKNVEAILADYAGREQRLRKELLKKYGAEPAYAGRGPLRVWPGGLMMTRTLGDKDAIHAIATPEVYHTLLPSGGGRLIVASDGLWDEFSPAAASRLVRKRKPQPAASELVTKAAKKAGSHRDDITVIVLDVKSAPAVAGSAMQGGGRAKAMRWACSADDDDERGQNGGQNGRSAESTAGEAALLKIVRAAPPSVVPPGAFTSRKPRTKARSGARDRDEEEEKAEEREVEKEEQKPLKVQEMEGPSSLSLSQTYYHIFLILGAVTFAGAGFFDGSGAIDYLAESLPLPKVLLGAAGGGSVDLDDVDSMVSGDDWGAALKHARAAHGGGDEPAEMYEAMGRTGVHEEPVKAHTVHKDWLKELEESHKEPAEVFEYEGVGRTAN
jgi:serine/threonine protein phosphatase PrpC